MGLAIRCRTGDLGIYLRVIRGQAYCLIWLLFGDEQWFDIPNQNPRAANHCDARV